MTRAPSVCSWRADRFLPPLQAFTSCRNRPAHRFSRRSITWRGKRTSSMASSSSRQNARGGEAPVWFAARRVAGAAVQFAQSFKDGIDADGGFQSVRSPQRRARSDRRSIGRPGGEDRSFFGQREVWMRYHVLWVLEDGAGVQQRLEVEDIVVDGGRRPHVFLHSKTGGAAARHNEVRAAAKRIRSGRFGFELMDVVRGRSAVDGYPPRLHGFGNLPDQFDLEQTVV